MSICVWSFKKIPPLNNQLGFVNVLDDAKAALMFKYNLAQDPRIGATPLIFQNAPASAVLPVWPYDDDSKAYEREVAQLEAQRSGKTTTTAPGIALTTTTARRRT